MKNKYIFILILCILSCHKKGANKTIEHLKKNDNIQTISQITSNYDTLVHKVLNSGDIDSYDELFYGFMDSDKIARTDSVMVYSKIMAEKYNYKKAYYDYLKAVCEKFDIYVDYPNYSEIDLSKIDSSSKIQAINWLKKMLENKIITKKEFDEIKK